MTATSPSPGVPLAPPSATRGYFLAAMVTGAAIAARYALTPVLGDEGRFLPLPVAVLLSAWFWGLGPGLLAAGLSVVAGTFLFAEPEWSLPADSQGWWHAAAYALQSLVICGLALTARRIAGSRAAARAQAIAERDRAQGALAASEERYRLASQAANDAIYDWDIRNDTLAWSRAMADVFGWKSALSGTGFQWWSDRIHPDDLARVSASLDGVVEGVGQQWREEYRFRRADGSYADVLDRGVVVRGPGGAPLRMVGAMLDISDRKRVETALRESTAMLQTVLDNIPQGVFWKDVNSAFLGANPVALRAMGFADPAALIGKTDADLPHATPEQVEFFRRIDREVMESGRPRLGIVEPLGVAEGKTAWLETNKMPLRDAAGRVIGVLGTWQDITERKRAEEALRESEERFRFLADAMPQLVWTARPDGTVDYYNERIHEFMGPRRAESGVWEWRPLVHPDELKETTEAWRSSVRTGETYQVEHRVQRADGGYRWHLSRALPVRDAQGRIVKWFGTATDIHDLKTAEAELSRYRHQLEDLIRERTMALESSSQRLRLAERMASLGTLSTGIGHDMGNLLLPIRARLDLLEDRGLPAAFAEDVAAIRQATDYLQSLAAGLRLLARDPEAAADQTTDLSAWWSDAQSMLRNALPRRFSLECEFPADLPPVRIGPPALMQAVFNIVQNAGDAMEGQHEGSVTIAAKKDPDGCWVDLTVRDTGPGMRPEVRARVLEPFFTTKTRSISTGLGLSLVHGLIQKAGGTVQVESEPGRGSAFTLRLPVATAPGAAAPAERPCALISLRDARLNSYAATVLSAMGFEVKTAPGAGDETLRLWVVDPESSDARSLRAFVESRPDRRVIVLGNSAGENDPQIVALSGPIRPSALREAARQAL